MKAWMQRMVELKPNILRPHHYSSWTKPAEHRGWWWWHGVKGNRGNSVRPAARQLQQTTNRSTATPNLSCYSTPGYNYQFNVRYITSRRARQSGRGQRQRYRKRRLKEREEKQDRRQHHFLVSWPVNHRANNIIQGYNGTILLAKQKGFITFFSRCSMNDTRLAELRVCP